MYQPDIDRLQEFWRTLQDMWIKLYGMNRVTIAAINVRQLWQQGFWVSVSSINGPDLNHIISPGWNLFPNTVSLCLFLGFCFTVLLNVASKQTSNSRILFVTGPQSSRGMSDVYKLWLQDYGSKLQHWPQWNTTGMEHTLVWSRGYIIKTTSVWTHLLIKYFFLILNPLSDSCSTM